MAFTKLTEPTITGRGAVAIIFHIPDQDNPDDEQYGRLSIQIKWSDGAVKENTFDLLEQLQDNSAGQTHLANLQLLKTYILSRIDTELIGVT